MVLNAEGYQLAKLREKNVMSGLLALLLVSSLVVAVVQSMVTMRKERAARKRISELDASRKAILKKMSKFRHQKDSDNEAKVWPPPPKR